MIFAFAVMAGFGLFLLWTLDGIMMKILQTLHGIAYIHVQSAAGNEEAMKKLAGDGN